jgi:hypothetical protein
MRLKQPLFYRQTGVRERAHLSRPRLIPIAKLTLPLESIYQFLPDDSALMGPSPQDPLLSDLQGGRVFIEHVAQLEHLEGGPRRTVLNPMLLQNEFRRKNRLFKPLRKDEALTINPKNLLIVNYALLSSLYRYIPSFKAGYFRWKNVAATFWDRVQQTHERFGWNQFIDLHLPDAIPTHEQFLRMQNGLNQKNLEVFNTNAALHLLDLWHWLGDNRQASHLATLSEDALAKIHFIVKAKGYFFIINLGVIDEWRKDADVDGDTGLSGTVLQRRFLVLLHGLRDLLSGVTQLDAGTGEAPAEVPAAGTKPVPAEQLPAAQSAREATAKEAPQAQQELVEALALPGLNDLWLPEPKSPPVAPSLTTPAQPIAAEPADVLLPAEEQGDAVEATEPPSLDERLTQGVAAKAWELHEVGLMSPKAYQRALADAETYKRLKDPYGSGASLESMLDVTDDDLALPDEPDFPNRSTIPDKSMLSSKLKGLQKKYVRKVLRKDIVSAVLAIQSQGVAVKDYSVETVRDAMNHYEIHTVTVKPVRGRQSTLRFRLPVVDDDGRFISNGVTYKMRLQRAD